MSSINTGIEWTDKTWNPITGCNKISPGCLHCYAEALTKRFPKGFPNGFDLTLHPDRLDTPKKWRNPSRIFVNSMSDLFHEKVPLPFIEQVFHPNRNKAIPFGQAITDDRIDQPELVFAENIVLGLLGETFRHKKRTRRKPPLCILKFQRIFLRIGERCR